MVRVILNGCCGHMGQVISGLISKDENCEVAAGIDPLGRECVFTYPIFTDINMCNVEADVLIDFSSYKATDQVIEYCLRKELPLVECTTGLLPEQTEKLMAASEKIAVMRSANMSLGVNALLKIVAAAAKIFTAADFDVEIVEKHHNLKKDAPSGTALALADSINEACDDKFEYVYDRSGVHEERGKKEIGISAVRGGTIVGEHEVIFAGTDEVIEIKHTAYSKAVFGKGAIEAGKFIAGKPAGLYTMQDLV